MARKAKAAPAKAPAKARKLYVNWLLDITPAALETLVESVDLEHAELWIKSALKTEAQQRVRTEIHNFLNEAQARVDRAARGE